MLKTKKLIRYGMIGFVIFSGLAVATYLISDYWILSGAKVGVDQKNSDSLPTTDETISGENTDFNEMKIEFSTNEIIQFTKYDQYGYYFNVNYFKFLFLTKFIELLPTDDNINLDIKVDNEFSPRELCVTYTNPEVYSFSNYFYKFIN